MNTPQKIRLYLVNRYDNAYELIHCNACGEDYSATYKRCPFCSEKYDNRSVAPAADDDDDDDGYVFDGQDLFDDPEESQTAAPKGGKRLNGTATASRRVPPAQKRKAEEQAKQGEDLLMEMF